VNDIMIAGDKALGFCSSDNLHNEPTLKDIFDKDRLVKWQEAAMKRGAAGLGWSWVPWASAGESGKIGSRLVARSRLVAQMIVELAMCARRRFK
ncbi:hypothetical protein CRG98_028221, partial [Punica granatum]